MSQVPDIVIVVDPTVTLYLSKHLLSLSPVPSDTNPSLPKEELEFVRSNCPPPPE